MEDEGMLEMLWGAIWIGEEYYWYDDCKNWSDDIYYDDYQYEDDIYYDDTTDNSTDIIDYDYDLDIMWECEFWVEGWMLEVLDEITW